METITVSKKHLEVAITAVKKQKFHIHNCLIAQAFKTAFPKKKVTVSYAHAEVGTGKNKKTYLIPGKVTKLIHRFDNAITEENESKLTRLRTALPVSFNAEVQ